MATDISFDTVTTGAIDGTGYFDKMMASINVHIQNEFNSGRIKGTDYATVYLGSMQTAMQQSIQFALQENLTEAQVDKIEYDKKIALATMELGTIADLYKTKQVVDLPSDITDMATVNATLTSIKTDAGVQ